MNYRIITKIACRLIALHFMLLSLNFIPNLIANLIYYADKMDNMDYQLYTSLAMVIPMIITAILLWIFADKISRRIVSEPIENPEVQESNYNNIGAIAFAVVGLLILANSIPDVASKIFQFLILTRDSEISMNDYIYKDFLPRIIGDIVKSVIGLWLFLGSKGFAKALVTFRELGTSSIEEKK